MGLSAIQKTWGVDASTYRRIHAELERGMQEKNILGIRLQGFSAQHRLADVITNTHRHIQQKGMLKNHNVDQNNLEEGLRRMAQILNQNKRRQIYRIRDKQYSPSGEQKAREHESMSHLDITAKSDLPCTSHGSNTTTESAPPTSDATCSTLLDFSSAMISVRRWHGDTTICRPDDFHADSASKAKHICVDHLQFDRFLRVVTDELQYNMKTDILFYNRENGEKICLLTERAWRAALSDMYGDGLRTLAFGIDRKPVSGSGITFLRSDEILMQVGSRQRERRPE